MDSRRASPVPLAGVTSDGGLRAISVTEMKPWLSEVEQHSMPGGLGLITSPARGGQYDGDILSPRQLFVPRMHVAVAAFCRACVHPRILASSRIHVARACVLARDLHESVT